MATPIHDTTDAPPKRAFTLAAYWLILTALALGILWSGVGSFAAENPPVIEKKWFRGNTHTHSLWSDGNDFPEMIIDWYQKKGYDFIALSDHNILASGDRWMKAEAIKARQQRLGKLALEKYQERFGKEWVQTRDGKDGLEVRLRTLAEFKPLFDQPDNFLVIPAEEITTAWLPSGAPKEKAKQVHINAINLKTAIKPQTGSSPQDLIRKTLQTALAQEKENGQPMLIHLNHPNFQWSLTADDFAAVVEERFFEVYNGHPQVHHQGDATRLGTEAMWDLANTIRLAELKAPLLYGIASDDSHHYHGGEVSPGRGWVMVQAAKLSAPSLIDAMKAGDFYASSGVFLDSLTINPTDRKIRLKIRPETGATHSAQLIGTRRDFTSKDGHREGVGIIFAEKSGDEIEFTVPAEALFTRITVTSTLVPDNPSFEGQKRQAWTQPVAW